MIRSHPRRLLSAGIAVALGVAFLTLGLLAGDSLRATLVRGAAASVGEASVVVTFAQDAPGSTLDAPQALRALPGVTAVRTEVSGHLRQDLGGRTGILLARSVPRLSSSTTLAAGRLPSARGEVAVNTVTAETRSLVVGSDVRLLIDPDSSVTARVVGIVRAGSEAGPSGMPQLYGGDADLMGWLGSPGYSALYVSGSESPEAMADAVRAAVPEGTTVRTAAAEIERRTSDSTRGVTQLTAMLSLFGVVALFVAALVIGNTFAILVAQRTRQLALLRCVGATRAQVFRGVLAEAALVGTVGSAIGVALGAGALGALIATGTTLGLPLTDAGMHPGSLAVPFLAGIVLTLAASLPPARRATAVAPLAALRPLPVDEGRRTGRVRLGVGVAAFVAGIALLGAGVALPHLVVGVAGGMLSFLGVLAVLPIVVPAVAGLLGMATPGVPGRLAVDNARRNPHRAATTTGALLVGVALITMLGVGAETGRASIDAEMGRQFPADAVVTAARPLTPQAREVALATPGVAAVTETAHVGAERSGGPEVHGMAVGPDAAAVLRDTAALDGLREGVVLVAAKTAAEGEELRLTVADRTLVLTAHVTGGIGGTPVFTLADAHRLVPELTDGFLVRFSDDADATATLERLGDRLAAVSPGIEVAGPAAMRQEVQSMIDTVLLVAVALLGVAVVIALVGVGNTLGLSVVERTQETGLLRALGLTRAQVRGMLGVEALTLSAVAVVLGLVLGTGYGIVGIRTVFGESPVPVVVAIPWARLAIVALVALVAGWLASVLPAARASRVSPSAALAVE